MIPFVDLKAQYIQLEKQIRQRIDAVLNHGKFIMGPEVQELERALAEFAGVKHAVTCSSRTDALLMPLMALGIGPGDAVFTTPFTFIATAEIISLLGATPIFVDIDPVTFNMEPEKLKQAVEDLHKENSKYPYPDAVNRQKLTAKAIITVDLFGLPCDYDSINKIAAEHNLSVIEDAAQAFGGEYKGKRACSLSLVGSTSFFPAKPLGCYGDGGAIFTDDDELQQKLVSIRVHGKGTDKYDNVRTGLNGRMDTFQAAILLPKIAAFAEEIGKRQEIAQKYTNSLQELVPVIKTPVVPDDYLSVWAQYSLLAENESKRTALQQGLKEAGIPTAVYYPKPLHLQTAFAGYGYQAGDMPVSEDCSQRIFSLPMHPYLKAEDQAKIIQTLSGLC